MKDGRSGSGAPGDRQCPLGRAGPTLHTRGAGAILQGQGRDPCFGLLSPGEVWLPEAPGTPHRPSRGAVMLNNLVFAAAMFPFPAGASQGSPLALATLMGPQGHLPLCPPLRFLWVTGPSPPLKRRFRPTCPHQCCQSCKASRWLQVERPRPPDFCPLLVCPFLLLWHSRCRRDSQVAQAQPLERRLLSLLAQTLRTGRTRSLHLPTQALVVWVCL